MANTTYSFYRGLLANLPEKKKNGTIYFTTDERAIYTDISDTERIRIGDFQEFATIAELQANTNPSTSALYYVADINVLCKWNGEGYIQINTDTGVTSFVKSGDGNVITDIQYDPETRIATLVMDSVDVLVTADEVNTTAAIKVTTAVGNYKKGDTIAADTDIQTLILNMLCQDVNPTATKPSTTITLTGAGAKEVGTVFTPNYTTTFSAGKYTANGVDQATEITASSYSVSDGTSIKTTASGSFDSFTVAETTNYSLTSTVEHTQGVMPTTYLGKDYPAVRIAADKVTATSGKVTGYRAWFYGYKNADGVLDVNNLTSTNIRALTSSNGSIPFSITTNKMQQMFFAIPASKNKSTITVANSTNGAPQTVYGPIAVAIEGANNYTAIDYDVWYVNNATAESGSTTFEITVS